MKYRILMTFGLSAYLVYTLVWEHAQIIYALVAFLLSVAYSLYKDCD